jgi:hypothetical protein
MCDGNNQQVTNALLPTNLAESNQDLQVGVKRHLGVEARTKLSSEQISGSYFPC